MSDPCRRFRRALLEDPPRDPGAEGHAAGCARCREALDGDRRILAAAEAWRRSSPQPPPRLRERIEARLAAEDARPAAPARAIPFAWRSRPAWLAAAAAALLGIGLALWLTVPAAPPDEVAAAIEQADAAHRAYARAIAALQERATVVLARAADPGTPPRQAAILLAYRDRLAHLDAVIDEVSGFLGDHPGHSGGHTVLLAAYEEKSEVLQEILDLEIGEAS